MLKKLALLLMLLPLMLCAANIGITIDMDPPATINDGKDLFAAGYAMISAPGYLQLPQKTVNVLLPPDAIITGHNIQGWGDLRISAPEPAINQGFSNGEEVLGAGIYRGSYPRSIYLGTKQWGDLRFASFRILPAEYDFARGEYVWQTRLSISVDYDQSGVGTNVVPPSLSAPESFFANHGDISKWYRPADAKNFDYLVVSTPALYAAASSLVAFRQSQGLITAFADIANVLATSPGTTAASKLRNYLKAQYD
ncbi:MAG: hypothetical protein U1B83_01240, partial [Candidatus Cloacimonadaceae bacterium]|nr:hypothetical protein [Candidatus Cloacimonadaceae bacterium]